MGVFVPAGAWHSAPNDRAQAAAMLHADSAHGNCVSVFHDGIVIPGEVPPQYDDRIS